jgi:hypothetical protein
MWGCPRGRGVDLEELMRRERYSDCCQKKAQVFSSRKYG